MEVKPAYKQTEVGMIPKDWRITPCSAISDLITVGIVIRPTQYYVKQGVPALRSANIRADGINDQDMVFISEKANMLLSKSQVRTGDVLTVRTGYPGTSAIVPQRHAGSNCIDILITRPSKTICPSFLSAWINSSFGKSQVLRNQGGLAQQHFNVCDLRNLVVALPPTITEQESIAEALNDVDSLMESIEQLLVKKRDNKKGAMQELLTGKKRLTGFSGEWVLRPLVDLVKADKFAIVDGPFGTQMKVEEYVPEGVPVIEMAHLEDNVITQEIKNCITEKKFEQLRRSAVFPGDIVISKTGSLGYLGIIPESLKRGIITSRLAKISLNASRANRSFIFQCLLKLRKDGYWESVSQGGTMQILGIRMLQNAPIPWISLPEQTAIAAILSDMDTEIAQLEMKLTKARYLKQGMMQELLTGRIRLV
jgi:type I restriction enzyme S subunit